MAGREAGWVCVRCALSGGRVLVSQPCVRRSQSEYRRPFSILKSVITNMDEKECEDKRLLSMLAAFIDGEGTIGIRRAITTKGSYTHNQYIGLANTDIRLMKWVVDHFGGRMPKPKRDKRSNYKDKYTWYLGGFNSYQIIRAIRPYLVLKQEQADNAITLYEEITKWHYNPLPNDKRELAGEIFQSNKELNKRGRPMDEEEIEIPVIVKIRKCDLDNWI